MHLTKNYWVLKMNFTIFFKEQQKLLRRIDTETKRYLYQEIDFTHKAILLIGQRRVGKTTLMLQHLKDLQDSFVVADNIEIGFGNKIPLWLFGFLY
jgi:predicted AAA+ superfamily ATPase